MGQVHVRPDPTTRCPFDPPSLEERIWQHCLNEALREIQCLSEGRVYEWQPFEDRNHLQPSDFFEWVKG